MTSSRGRYARLALAWGLAALTLLLSGCVYLRLLELKKQLNEFDQHFVLQTKDGLSLVCQDPVLRTKDVRWMGLRPEQTKKLGLAEQWQVRWVKQLPVGIAEPGTFDIIIELGFADDKLTRVKIPERYFSVLPKDFLIGVIKSVGRGKIDKSSKKIESSLSASEVANARPNLPDIDKLLGRPSEETEVGPNTVVRYRYIPATSESKAGVFDMHLTFHTKTGELLHWHGKTPIGNIAFNFGPQTAK